MSRWAHTIRHKILVKATIKWQVLVNFVDEFSPRTVSPEKGFLASAHKKVESSKATLVKIESSLEDHEIIKEPPQSAQVTIAWEITGVSKVNIEPPQIDLS